MELIDKYLLPLLMLVFQAGVLVMTLRTKISKSEALELIQDKVNIHEDYCPLAKELRHKLDTEIGATMKKEIEHLRRDTDSIMKELSQLREDLHGLKNLMVKLTANIELMK